MTSISKDEGRLPEPFPLEVDGDYIGERTKIELRAEPGALTVVA